MSIRGNCGSHLQSIGTAYICTGSIYRAIKHDLRMNLARFLVWKLICKLTRKPNVFHIFPTRCIIHESYCLWRNPSGPHRRHGKFTQSLWAVSGVKSGMWTYVDDILGENRSVAKKGSDHSTGSNTERSCEDLKRLKSSIKLLHWMHYFVQVAHVYHICTTCCFSIFLIDLQIGSPRSASSIGFAVTAANDIYEIRHINVLFEAPCRMCDFGLLQMSLNPENRDEILGHQTKIVAQISTLVT